jgi:hypothetical protein
MFLKREEKGVGNSNTRGEYNKKNTATPVESQPTK